MNILNPKNPSHTTKHNFANIPQINAKRSSFKTPSTYKTMFDAGKLIPFLVQEVLPGDTWKFDNTILCRLTTPLVPFMDNLYLDTQYFFVPNRLVWTNWTKFMGEKVNPGDSATYTVPVVTGPAAGFLVESIYDYMGIPINMTKNVNALPLRAYNLIYNEFYRDQNIINSLTFNTGNGPDVDTDYAIRRRGKRHDYFTSCLPSPQRGTASGFSLTGTAPVLGIGSTDQTFPTINQVAYESDGTTSTYANAKQVDPAVANETFWVEEGGPAGIGGTDNYPWIRADLSAASAITINAWRQALQLQALAEIDMRGGTRYIEILYSHFQVISPDARLQRPEYLGGSTIPIYVTPVANTSTVLDSMDGATDWQGDLAAYAAGVGRGDGFSKSFTEHGYIIGICSVRADLTYSQGLNRTWTRSTKYDYFWPLLQHIGEQAVLTQEIFLHDSGAVADAVVFGYQERYAEYMYRDSLITGKLRPAYVTPLDWWHLSQEFSSAPTLSQSFIEENPPVSRVVTVTSQPQFIMDVYMDTVAVRPMAMYSIPGYLGRF